MGYRLKVMRVLPESLAFGLAPLVGLAIACAAPAAAVTGTGQPKSRLQPQLTTEQEPAGFRVKSQQLALQPISLDVSRFAFTAPGRVASSSVRTVERSFNFTPSGAAAKRGVSVGMTARSVVPAATERSAAVDTGLAPAGYNFDLSLGYRGFAVTGGVSRVDTGLGGRSREGVDVGVGYGRRNWKAGISAMAEREDAALVPRAGTPDPRYSLEARGALALSPKVSLGGSLRYRLAPETPTPLDPDKDDRAVMLGGAVAF
jgi:hypothetical protein